MYQTPLNRSRLDKFTLILDLPKSVKNIIDPVLQDNLRVDPIQFSIFGSPVPSINVPAIDVPYGGHVYKTSSFSRPAYDPLNIKFLVDSGYKNYWVLWNWLNVLNDYKTSTSMAQTFEAKSGDTIILNNKMTDFTSKFKIFALDEYDNKIMSFQYDNCLPTSLSELAFSSQEPNEVTANVTFVFNTLEVNLLKDVNRVNC
jgi:hypothetical protein